MTRRGSATRRGAEGSWSLRRSGARRSGLQPERWDIGVSKRRTIAIVTVLSLGCGSGESSLRTTGVAGVPSAASVGANLLFGDATLDGYSGRRLLVDTGSPFTLVNPALFPGVALPVQTDVTVDVGVGSLVIEGVPALQLFDGGTDVLQLGGVLGANVLRQFSTQLNYRDQLLCLGDGVAPANIEQPGATFPFVLEGGGVASTSATTTSSYAATRIPVTATVEGVDHQFILDSGASEVAVRSTLFVQLTADGRPFLDGFPVYTAGGATSGEASRMRIVSVGGEAVTNVPFLNIGDMLLDQLGTEIGHPVDGLLGGSFLREFLVTVDYPRSTVHLQRYANRDHIMDEFKRVGIALGPGIGTHRFNVATVYAGSDAAQKGLSLGDEVVTVDGQSLDALDEISADQLLCGTVGTVRQLGFGQTLIRSLTNSEVGVLVDDLIPIPSS